MSSFFNSLIIQDRTSPPSPVPKVAVNPSVAELVRLQMERLEMASLEARPSEELTIPNNINILKPVTDINVAVVEEIKAKYQKELPDHIKITGDNESIKKFLPEVYELLRIGKELDLLLATRKEQVYKNGKAKEQAQNAINQASTIRDNIAKFLESDDIDTSKEKLMTALSGYENFLNSFVSEKNDEETFLRNEDNKLIVRINTMKSKIAKMIQNVGGMKNLDGIKTRFRKFNEMRTGVSGYEQKIISEIHGVLDKTNPEDSKIIRELAGSEKEGRIIDIFKILYGIKIENN